MKTIIHVWTHTFNINKDNLEKFNTLNEKEFYFGLGDLIRSTIKLFVLSKKMNFNLYVDLQLHPIADFLDIPFNPLSENVLKNKDNIDYVCYGGVEDYINSHKDNEIMYILTNDFYHGEISKNEQDYIKTILKPNTKFQNYIDLVLAKIPFDNFNIFHLRIGDDFFHNKQSNISVSELISFVRTTKDKNDILITDSEVLKKEIFLNEKIYTLNTYICHLGIETNKDKIRDTLLEFFLISKSKKIKTLCKIHQVSGFVKWVSLVYGIELIQFN
jgi:hypothetical protein